jgi:pyruvate/2-oxoglutarate dehydrogenase complex dihydrolipoamide acyltransferase (E2) component
VSIEVRLPQWGMGMTDGTVVEWLKKLGDPVARGEPLARVDTAKVTMDLEAPETGVLTEIKVEEGTTVEIYTVLAVIQVA